jgi:predicted small secreted protein
VLAVIAVSAVIVLAACGSTTAGGAGHPASAGVASASAGAPLCAAAPTVDRVVASLPAGHLREVLPRGITITDAPRVRALAAALCALPPMPSGLQPCPADFGGVFQLVFAAGGRAFHPVRIQLSGCRTVAGIGPTRSWSRSPQFGRLLTETVGGKGRLIPGMHPSSVPTP